MTLPGAVRACGCEEGGPHLIPGCGLYEPTVAIQPRVKLGQSKTLVYEPHDVETRLTDESTGGQKGTKLTQLGALDPIAMIELARVAGMGAAKYAAFNYLKGYDWALSFNAMMRHALLFWAGEDHDPESGLSHMAHAAWMALSLVSFSERGLGTDTRYQQKVRLPDDTNEVKPE